MEKGSLAHLGIGTGSETGSDGKADESKRTQAVDSIGAPDRSRTCNPLIYSQWVCGRKALSGEELTEILFGKNLF